MVLHPAKILLCTLLYLAQAYILASAFFAPWALGATLEENRSTQEFPDMPLACQPSGGYGAGDLSAWGFQGDKTSSVVRTRGTSSSFKKSVFLRNLCSILKLDQRMSSQYPRSNSQFSKIAQRQKVNPPPSSVAAMTHIWSWIPSKCFMTPSTFSFPFRFHVLLNNHQTSNYLNKFQGNDL